MDLRTAQEWTVRLILRTAPGVDDVTSWGGGERQYQVQIDPQRLYARDLSFSDVLAAITANNGQVGGNVMAVGQEQFLIRGLGLLQSTEDIGAIVLKSVHGDRKSRRLNSSPYCASRLPYSAGTKKN